MKNPRVFGPGRIGCMFGIVNALLAIGLTFASLAYVQPRDCNRLCDAPEGAACPSGACRFNEQRAGWPLAVLVDYPGGGSPTNGWGKLGLEDPPIPGPFILDVLFYSLLLWAAFGTVQIIRAQPVPLKLIGADVLLTGLLGVFVWFAFFVIRLRMGG